jgi:two-component sensor histidine kinase
VKDIIQMIDAFATRRTTARYVGNNSLLFKEAAEMFDQIESRIQAMQEICDAAVNGDPSGYDYHLIKAILKYKEVIK